MSNFIVNRVFYMLAVVMLVLPASVGYCQSIPIGENQELTCQIPKGWTYERRGPQVQIALGGADGGMMVVCLPLDEHPELDTQEGIDKMLKSVCEEYASQSVEKKVVLVPLPGMIGSYANFTDLSLVDAPIQPDQYKVATIGMVKQGSSLLHFTVLSQSTDSDGYKNALGIITTASITNVATNERSVVIPGQKWKILFKSPVFHQERLAPTPEGVRYTAVSTTAFSMSLFVEDPTGDARGNKACADHYWALAKRNPMIDQASVVTKKHDDFVLVSYVARLGGKDETVLMPNANLYFEHKGKWVDVHISQVPIGEPAQPVLDNFVKSFKYQDIEVAAQK